MERSHPYLHTTVGSLYVEERLPNTLSSTSARWKCRCKCGKYKILRSGQLKSFEDKDCSCYGTRTNISEGQKFNSLTAIKLHSTDRNGHAKWLCKCDCGEEVTVYGTHLIRGNTKSCGCTRFKRGEQHAQWTGVGEISGNYWRNTVMRSDKSRRKIEVNIDKEYAWQLFLDQDRKCALTGLELHFSNSLGDVKTTASLDRIDSSKGYIKGNVQWVHKDINMMKRIYDQDYFIKMCKLVAENN